MDIILFTKSLKGLSVEGVGEVATRLGVKGLDLAVRAGHCVDAVNAATMLPDAVKLWRQMGLSVTMVTLETSFIDPATPEAESIFRACGESGIQFIKLGYYRWQPGQDYWQGVQKVRQALTGFEKLGKEYGVCSLMHTHSGSWYGSNASGLVHLISGFDSRYIGAYLDPAHQALDGETSALSLAIVGEYLKVVAAKNTRYVATQSEAGAGWDTEWCLLRDGIVSWPKVIEELRAVEYSGPLSLHAEYSGSLLQTPVGNGEPNSISMQLAAQDMSYLGELI